MPQFARPNADLTVFQWMICMACSGPLFEQINEVIPVDADYIETIPNPVNAVYETGLSPVIDPQTDVGHILRYRFRKDGAAGRPINLTVELLQGAMIIASFNELDIPLTTMQAEHILTPAQAAAITNYSDLRIRFTASFGTGMMSARAVVTWAEFEVPDPPPPPPPPPPPDPTLRRHTIKTLKVFCLERVQRTDNLTVQLTGVVAPVGPLQVEVEVTDFAASVFEDKVFSIWTLNITATDANGSVFTATTTYREDVVHCPVDLTQWPGQNVVQKHDSEGFQVVGPVDFTPGVTTPTVTFAFVLKYCLVVAKEVLVKINGAIPVC